MHGPHFSVTRDFIAVQNALSQPNQIAARDILSGAEIEAFVEYASPDFRDRIFAPDVTLMAFLAQVMAAESSCQQAVIQVRAERVANGLKPCAMNTSSYSRARQRLPLQGIVQLAKDKASELECVAPEEWLWKGRNVKIIDGSTLTAADTIENQAVFPQHPNQKPGLGFPLVRLAIMTSLASGAAFDVAYGPFMGKNAGELPLAVKLLDNLKVGDVLVGDRYYLTYFFIALVAMKGADFVTRHFDHRKFNIIARKRLNKNDEIITLKKPRRPHTGWLDCETYKRVPETLVLRKSKVKISRPGYRDEWLTVISTLLDDKRYSREDLSQVYYCRWQVELDLRVIKKIMHMDHLEAKSPDMIGKGIWMRILAYNLIRLVMAKAADASGKKPRHLSFKGCVAFMSAYQAKWRSNDIGFNRLLFADLLQALSMIPVAHQQGRSEPRAVKRRSQTRQRQLKVPRAIWKTATNV